MDNTVPYHIVQPSTDNDVQIVSLDAAMPILKTIKLLAIASWYTDIIIVLVSQIILPLVDLYIYNNFLMS